MDSNDFNHRHSSRETYDQARWIPALVLISIGAAFLLNNLHIVPFHELFQYWPVALVALGLFRLVDSTQANQRLVGAVLIAVGAVLLAGTLGFYYFSWNTLWPLLLIGAGLLMLVQRLAVNVNVLRDSSGARVDWLHEAAIFSGGKRRIKGDFKGGKLDCIFGGFEINLRQATISGDSVELEINSIFGGAEIKIPESWEVVMQGTGIFGGFGDESTHPDTGIYPNPKRLIIKGAAIFGGVNVKN